MDTSERSGNMKENETTARNTIIHEYERGTISEVLRDALLQDLDLFDAEDDR